MKYEEFLAYSCDDGVRMDTDENDRGLRIYAGLTDKGFESKRKIVIDRKHWLSKPPCDPLDRLDPDDECVNANFDFHVGEDSKIGPVVGRFYKVYDDDGNLIGYEMLAVSSLDYNNWRVYSPTPWRGQNDSPKHDVPIHSAFVFSDEVDGWDINDVVMLLANRFRNVICEATSGEEMIMPFDGKRKMAGQKGIYMAHYNGMSTDEQYDRF